MTHQERSLSEPSLSRHAVTRRDVLQAGTIGLMGLSMADVARWRCQAAETGATLEGPKSVIYIFSLVRSLTHKENGHDKGTYVMLTGNTVVPPTFRSSKPQSIDLPSIAGVAGYSAKARGNMPTSVILPEKLYHSNSGTYAGQFAGLLGPQYEPWLVECTDKPHAYHALGIPRDAKWYDSTDRPCHVYQADPIRGLMT